MSRPDVIVDVLNRGATEIYDQGKLGPDKFCTAGMMREGATFIEQHMQSDRALLLQMASNIAAGCVVEAAVLSTDPVNRNHSRKRVAECAADLAQRIMARIDASKE